MRRSPILGLATLALVCSLLLACGGTGEENKTPYGGEEARSDKQRVTAPTVDPADLSKQVEGNNSFAFDLYQEVRPSNTDNIFYSPHSMSIALAMLYAGAKNNTEAQMATALHYDLAQQKLHPVFNALDQALNSRGQGKQAADGGKFRLNVVNAVWGQRGYDFQMPYLDTLALNYGAGLRLLDFAGDSEGSREVINKWVEQMTEERIKDLLPRGSIDGLTRLVLTNAIYFNAAWATPFEESNTKDGPFTLAAGKQVTVPLMAGTMDGSYAKGTDCQAAALPYDGGELSMLVILPDEGKFDSVEQSLSTKFLDGLLGQMAGVKLDLTLPKFEIEHKMDLVPPLSDMGMTEAFTPGEADLSGIDGTRNLYVTGVLHKAFVKVNEAGTEAAAATAVIVGATSVPQFVTFKVDRPFIFLIRDHATGAIIFIGRVLDPS